MAKPTSPHKKKDIEQYKHKDKSRLNNPQVGMVSQANDPDAGKKKYSYDPHLDPTLEWTGKKEQGEIGVDTVSIHVHERIDPKSIIQQVHKQNVKGYQHSLFEEAFDHRPVRDEVSFYQHKNAWANRLIAGDSLLVMNSLLEKEGMAGQVQTIFIDPPYGVKYGSNFQPYTNKRDVKDGRDDDLTTEPEMLKAFRDTWELGIHSYLSYMRDRILLSKELLSDSGSIFVQISDENVHYIRNILDEVFGPDNFVSQIFFTKTTGQASYLLPSSGDMVIWYAKNKANIKYRPIYVPKNTSELASYNSIESADGSEWRKLTKVEVADNSKIPDGWRIFSAQNLRSQGYSSTSTCEYTYKGKTYYCGDNNHWKTPPRGLDVLAEKGRLIALGNSLNYKRYFDDLPVTYINDVWNDTAIAGFSNEDKIYVVQTAQKVIQRCILMTTDPGDLVFDPTCGSGTTAAVAEQWGRRWITCDTSRISLQLAKQRVLTSVFSWYKLAHDNEGIAGGFVLKTVPHVTLKSIANHEPPSELTLQDQPEVDNNIVRVAGPYTVEAIPAITVKSLEEIGDSEVADNSIARTGETARQDDWRSELLKSGVRAKGGEKIEFARVELLQGTHHLHAEAETMDGKRVLVSFGPDHAPLEQKQVEMALEEAQLIKPGPTMVLFAAFQFDPEAAKDIDETNWAGVDLLKIQMNTDLLTGDLKKSQSSSESFWLVGQPDVRVTKDQQGKYVASVDGFDYYNPKTGEVTSGGKKEIAMWMLDTDYDGRSIFPTQVFFPMAGANDGWNKLAKNLKAELDESLLDKFEGTDSIAFEPGEYKRCAVKIIDNRGIESFCIKNLE